MTNAENTRTVRATLAVDKREPEAPMYDTANLVNLNQIRAQAPTTMHAFETFDRAATAAGAVPRKYKELAAIAVALTTQCPYSLEVHKTNAMNAGATDTEIAEMVFLAAAMRATAAVAHGTHLFRKPSAR
ncbi:MAG: carboxymuconolactone decarboxylase family protein [Hyphomicrobium sp.]